MKKTMVLLILFLFCMLTGISEGKAKEVLIQEFYMDPVFVYDSEDSYTEIPKASLPDPSKTKVVVKNYDQSEAMVMFTHEGREMWVSESEVRLNHTAVASIICTEVEDTVAEKGGTLTQPASKQPFHTLGLGEDCRP